MSGRAAQKETAANTRPPYKGGEQHDVQELWFATLRREWSSLVLVATHPGGGAAWVAEALADAAASLDEALRITPHGKMLASTRELMRDLTVEASIRQLRPGSDRWRGGQTIIAIEPVTSNPAGIPLALAADAVLLCVELGKTSIAVAQRTIELIGRERFIGCVVLR